MTVSPAKQSQTYNFPKWRVEIHLKAETFPCPKVLSSFKPCLFSDSQVRSNGLSDPTDLIN